MQRYFLNERDFTENIIHGSDVFHIIKVMRMNVNDQIEVCYDGNAYLAKINNLNENEVGFTIINKIESIQNKCEITLIQGIAKGDKNEQIIKHSTELGVDNIIFCAMTRSIAVFDDKKIASKLERFNKIAKEAAEQSHRNTIPKISYISNIKMLENYDFELKLLLDEEEAKKDNPLLIKNVDINKNNIAFLVGPEGGIAEKERQFCLLNQFLPISLGKNILRTETASLAFLAMLKYSLMEK